MDQEAQDHEGMGTEPLRHGERGDTHTWTITLLSTAIAAVLLGLLGRFIGNMGDPKHTQMGKTLGTWVGATMGGMLAAYTSLRTAHRNQQEQQQQEHLVQSAPALAVNDNAPKTTVQADEAALEHVLTQAADRRR